MTNAKLVTSLPEGCGITSRLAAELYATLVAEKPTPQIVVIGVLEPVGFGQSRTKNGTKQHVTLEAIKLEPVFDGHGADRIRHMLQEAWEARHSTQTLPLDWGGRGDDDRVKFLIGAIEEWAAENGHDEQTLRDIWVDYFGGPDYIVADFRKSVPLKLQEFALAKGVLAEGDPADDDADSDVEQDVDGDEAGE